MSEIAATVEEITAIIMHPNADRLEIAKILGTQVCVQKNRLKAGDKVVYFPPDLLLPLDVSNDLGVTQYLRTAEFDGVKIPCRVGATRLRGVPSFGFVAKDKCCNLPVGTEVSDLFRARKYEPPQRPRMQGDLAPDHPAFHVYTDIQHYWKYPTAIPEGMWVRVTEKIHGTNSRVGVIEVNGEWQFMAGSHKTNRKEYDVHGRLSLYWKPLWMARVLRILNELCDENRNVVIFGEIFGQGVQDLDYGVKQGQTDYRIFDISVDGSYVSWPHLKNLCDVSDRVPVLYEGPFYPGLVEELVDGPTVVSDSVRSSFKGREGIVITPQLETHSDVLGGRLILKAVSADYLSRKNAEDNE